MMCLSGCVVKVNSITNSIDGVKRASVDFKKGILTVKYDSLMVSEDFIINEFYMKRFIIGQSICPKEQIETNLDRA